MKKSYWNTSNGLEINFLQGKMMESVATSTTNQQQGRALLVEALKNFNQYTTIQAFIEKYWTWQKKFEEDLDQITKNKPSHAFYCQKKRCLVIGVDRLKQVYPNFELRTLENEVNAEEILGKKFQILFLKPNLDTLQKLKIMDIHCKLLIKDLIDNIQTVFAVEEHRSAVKQFWEYKVNRSKKSRINFIGKIYKAKLLSLEKKEERLSIKRDFVRISR